MSLSGVIFDLDGTIAESFPMAVELIGGAIAKHGGRELAPEEVIALFGPNERGIFRAAVGEEHWEEAWEMYLADYSSRHDLCPMPFPGIKDLIERLHSCGCRLGLVTGKTETTAGISLDVFGIAPLFSGVEGGSMDGVVKTEAIGRLLSSWQLPADAVAYIGDTAMDIRESKRAGVVAIGAAWSNFADASVLAAESPEAVFDSVEEFAGWVVDEACG